MKIFFFEIFKRRFTDFVIIGIKLGIVKLFYKNQKALLTEAVNIFFALSQNKLIITYIPQ